MGNKALLVDIGNTRIKYTWSESDQKLAIQTCESVDILFDLMAQAQQVVLASVRSQADTEVIVKEAQRRGIPITWVQTQAQTFGVHCAYENYGNLGIDRWLAVLGARAITDMPVAVIDLGTAATCDLVVDNQHLGGWIAPGFTMMRNSVTSGAARVFASGPAPETLGIGQDTPECVNYGCLAMLHGFVERAKLELSQHSKEYRIFVCGGDRQLIADIQDVAVEMVDELVFIGLKRFL